MSLKDGGREVGIIAMTESAQTRSIVDRVLESIPSRWGAEAGARAGAAGG